MSAVTCQVSGIVGSSTAYHGIVSALKCRVAVAVDIAVKDYHRSPRLVDRLYCRSDSVSLVGGHYDDVEIVVSEIAQVGKLLFIAVIG